MNDLAPLWLSLRLAFFTTLILLCLGTPLAWWLSRTRSWIKAPLEAVIALPIILPPTVIGFYLLTWFSAKGWLGTMWKDLTGHYLAFSFSGLLIGSIIYSLPFVVQPILASFEMMGKTPDEVGAVLGLSPWQRFWKIHFPLTKRGFITGAVLGFIHTIGEFGVVLMIGGNIPNRTRVLSIAIYEHVELLEFHKANMISLGLLLFSFAGLFIVFKLNKNKISAWARSN